MANELKLSNKERDEIATILKRRANEIAGWKAEHSCEKYPNNVPLEKQVPASVEYALDREIERLRKLESKVAPPAPPAEEDDKD